MRAANILIGAGCCFLSSIAAAQESSTRQQEVERIIDDILSQQDIDLNYDELYEGLLQRLSSPVNLNNATEEELRSLYILSEEQVQDLIEHRAINGELLSPYELQSIPSFGVDLIHRLLPLISVEPTNKPGHLLNRILNEDNNYLITRYERAVEPKAGFMGTVDTLHRFKGTPDKWYTRFRVSHPGDFSFGFTLEKDPGERSLADYFSFHAQVANKRRLSNLIVGDFQAQFGQGLILGGGFGIGKGSETVTPMRRNTLGFIPYSSVRESGYFHGVAASVSITPRLFAHAFGSVNKCDAVVVRETHGEYITSLQETGLHRSPMELGSRDAVKESNYGLVVEYRRRALQFGAMALNTQWNRPIRSAAGAYNQYDFSGRRSVNCGVFLNFNLANFAFFSEAGQTIDHGHGLVAGMLGSFTRNFDVSLVARTYQKDFLSLYGNAIAESSSAQNESGIYWGWKYQASRSISVAGYADLFTFPWMRFRSYSVRSTGHEYLLRLTLKPAKTATFFLQAKEEQKFRNGSPGTTVYKTVGATKRSFCVSADYTLGPVGLKTRVQFSTLDLGRTTGFIVAQDLSYERQRWSLAVRHALFDTDDFDNRQYVYEPDMWLSYSFPAFNGSGTRSMAMVRYRVSRRVDLWFRWARTLYIDTDFTGSGVDLVAGPARTDLRAQFRIRL